jgi:hypothetical protein
MVGEKLGFERNLEMILSLFCTFSRCICRPKMDIAFYVLVSVSHRCFNLTILLVARGFPSLLLPTLSGLLVEIKIWMFPKMGCLRTSAKEEGSDLSNLPLMLIHALNN